MRCLRFTASPAEITFALNPVQNLSLQFFPEANDAAGIVNQYGHPRSKDKVQAFNSVG